MLFATGVGHGWSKSITRNSILKEEMIIYFWFKLSKKKYFSGHDSARDMLPIYSITESEKGIETSISATKWKGGIDFNLIPKAGGGVVFNFSPEFSIGYYMIKSSPLTPKEFDFEGRNDYLFLV